MPNYHIDPYATMRNKNKRRKSKQNRETKAMLKGIGAIFNIIFLPFTLLVKLFFPKKR